MAAAESQWQMMQPYRKRCIIFATLCGVALTPTVSQLIDRRVPLVLLSGEFYPKQLRAGDPVRVRWRAVEHIPGCTGEYRRFFRDKSGKVVSTAWLPMVYGANWNADHTYFDIPIIVPDMLEGENTYWIEGNRWCSKVQSWWPIAYVSPTVKYTQLPSIPTPLLPLLLPNP